MDGNSKKIPVIVKSDHGRIPALKSVTIETVLLELYSWKATIRPFRFIRVDLNEGRIALKALSEILSLKEKIKEFYRIDAVGDVILLADEDGFSIQKWISGQTYKLRVKTSTSVDIEIPFSEKDQEKMNIITVRDDFNIQIDGNPWLFSGDSTGFPDALIQTLALYAQFNTLRLEASRRSIVSLFLHYAISTIAEGKSKLCIDEETPLAIVRKVDRDGVEKNVRYSGPVDFVIGHSKLLSNMPKDAAVIVIETKKSDTFDGSLPQVLAQAAALLFFRQAMKPPRGLNGSGGPIVFIRSDGERWIFSKLTSENGARTVQHSAEFKLNICLNKIEKDTVQQIFNWIRYAITVGRDSSPRASLAQVGQNVPVEEETVTTEFSSLQISDESFSFDYLEVKDLSGRSFIVKLLI